MASHRAPTQRALTKNENINTFECWRQTLTYNLALDPNFGPFLAPNAKWAKQSRTKPLRGFKDIKDGLTAAQQAAMLDLMLGQIANFCPVISRHTICKNSESLSGIWQSIRLHYRFQSSDAHLIDFSEIKLETDERPEDLYERLRAFIEDNLLTQNSHIKHHSETVTEDEELTPMGENLIVLTWLKLLYPDLPKIVKQRYGVQLRAQTLASIKPEISQALDVLLDEIIATHDMKTMRTAINTVKVIFVHINKINKQSPQNHVPYVIKLDDPPAIG